MNVRRGVRFDVLADRVMQCRSAVAAAGWTSGPGVCGFRRVSRKHDLRAEAAKPAADPGRGEPVGWVGRSQGRRRSSARPRASRSWVCAAMTSQVQRSAAAGSRSFGVVQPRVCLNRRKVCSRSKRRRNACQQRSTSRRWRRCWRTTATPVSGRGRRAGGRRAAGSGCLRGSGARRGGRVQAARWVSRGCSRSQAWARGGAVAGGVGRRGHRRGRARSRGRQSELLAVLGRAPARPGRVVVPAGAGPGRRASAPAPRPAGRRAGRPAGCTS